MSFQQQRLQANFREAWNHLDRKRSLTPQSSTINQVHHSTMSLCPTATHLLNTYRKGNSMTPLGSLSQVLTSLPSFTFPYLSVTILGSSNPSLERMEEKFSNLYTLTRTYPSLT